MKYSILIVNYKDYASLKTCLSLVHKREEKDYEVICWDNTPFDSDGPIGLNSLDSAIARGSCRYFGDGIGHGFAGGINRAAKHAKGEFLVFLNPDTEPSGDWLDRMFRGLEQGYDYIGCTSDYIAGIQQAARYLDDPREFVDTKLVIPVAAVIRRSLFEEMGGFDEGCFLGCEDLDFSWRMNLAGKRMGIATNVFIHHVGHTSFNTDSGESEKMNRQSEIYMREKLAKYYDGNPPSSEELWGCKIFAPSLRPQTLSICMIVKDNIKAADEAIHHASRIAENLFIVATNPDFHEEHIESGHIAYGEHKCIFHFYRNKWEDDFAAARNHVLSKSHDDWVLWLDADDIVEPDQIALINALLKKPGNLTALKACHFAFDVHNTDSNGKTMDSFAQSRLFPRLPGIRWGGLNGCHGYVHETTWESCEAAGLQLVKTNIVLKHTGYSDSEVLAKKQERNIRLLLKEPVNSFSAYNLGQAYLNVPHLEKALEYYKQALGLAENEPQFKDHIRYCIAQVYLRQKDRESAKPYLIANSKPDALFAAGEMMVLGGNEAAVEEGCDLLWAYLKMGKISDIFGSNYTAFRPAAINYLTQIGIIA